MAKESKDQVRARLKALRKKFGLGEFKKGSKTSSTSKRSVSAPKSSKKVSVTVSTRSTSRLVSTGAGVSP